MDEAGAPRIRREARLPDGEAVTLAGMTAALEPALREVAGEGATPVSLNLEVSTPPAAGAALRIDAWVERATRTLVFAAAEAWAGEARVAAVSAVFNREPSR